MFKKISLTLFLTLLSIHSTFSASDAAALAEPRVTIAYGKPATNQDLRVTFLMPATATHPAFDIHSITPEDWANLNALHGNADLMKHTGNGQTRAPDEMETTRYKPWAKRLENGMPWVGYPVYLASDATDADGFQVGAGSFVGMVGLALSDEPGYLLFWGLGVPRYQHKGWGTHIAEKVLFNLVPALASKFPFSKTPSEEVPVAGVIGYTPADRVSIQRLLGRFCPPDAVRYNPAAKIGLPEPQKRFEYPIRIEDLRDGRLYTPVVLPKVPETAEGTAAGAGGASS